MQMAKTENVYGMSELAERLPEIRMSRRSHTHTLTKGDLRIVHCKLVVQSAVMWASRGGRLSAPDVRSLEEAEKDKPKHRDSSNAEQA